MARVYNCGFEAGDLLPFTPSDNAYVSASTTHARTGTYSCRAYGGYSLIASLNNLSEWYMAVGVRFQDMSGYNNIVRWYKSSNLLGDIKMNFTTRRLEAYVGTTLVATGTTVLTVDTWYLLELHVKIADTGGVIEVRLDSNAEINYTGDTKPGTDTNVDMLRLCGFGNTTSQATYFDDFTVNDTSGTSDNSWVGDRRYIAVVPDGAGTTTQWTPSAGANYQCVDEIPPSSSDYVSTTATAQTDTYSMANPSLPSGATIQAVIAEARAQKTQADPATIANVIRSGGTDYAGSDQSISLSWQAYLTRWTTDPADSGAWTQAKVNALECGVRSG